MAKRRWRGQIGFVGVQTADGRMIEAGALAYVMPQPLAWAVDGTQHSAPGSVPQIGIIETATENGAAIEATGIIDTDIIEGAELVRRMEEGTASHQHRQAVSMDLAVTEVALLEQPTDDVAVMVASARLVFPAATPVGFHDARVTDLIAAAGDPIPDGSTETQRWSTEEFIEMVTVGSLAGVTAVATPAFLDAWIELDDTEADTEPEVEAVVAAAKFPAPPAEWFTDPQLDAPTRMVIDGRRIFGHAALWDSCHTAYDRCVTPPRGGDYSVFHSTGRVRCADGEQVGTGAFVWGIPHADREQAALDAFAHYEVAEYGFADVVVGEDVHGIWFSGALRPCVDDDDIAMLERLGVSGDWRRLPGTSSLSFVAGLAVNVPGFPIVDGLCAAGAPMAVFDAEFDLVALVAAGVVQPGDVGAVSSCSCGSAEAGLAANVSRLVADMAIIKARTAPMIPDAVAALAGRYRRT